MNPNDQTIAYCSILIERRHNSLEIDGGIIIFKWDHLHWAPSPILQGCFHPMVSVFLLLAFCYHPKRAGSSCKQAFNHNQKYYNAISPLFHIAKNLQIQPNFSSFIVIEIGTVISFLNLKNGTLRHKKNNYWICERTITILEVKYL